MDLVCNVQPKGFLALTAHTPHSSLFIPPVKLCRRRTHAGSMVLSCSMSLSMMASHMLASWGSTLSLWQRKYVRVWRGCICVGVGYVHVCVSVWERKTDRAMDRAIVTYKLRNGSTKLFECAHFLFFTLSLRVALSTGIATSAQKRVLVHCRAGVSRSVGGCGCGCLHGHECVTHHIRYIHSRQMFASFRLWMFSSLAGILLNHASASLF